jgi:hypothetical protein
MLSSAKFRRSSARFAEADSRRRALLLGRYQLVLKMVTLAFMFCSAMPILLPFSALFMYAEATMDF